MARLLLIPECVPSPVQWNTTAPPPLIVGHITFNAAVSGTDADFRSLDVTPYIAAGGPAIKTFMIVSLRPSLCFGMPETLLPCGTSEGGILCFVHARNALKEQIVTRVMHFVTCCQDG